DALRRSPGCRGQRTARPGAEALRFSGQDPHAGQGAIAECVGSGGHRVVRGSAAAAPGRIEVIMKLLCAFCVLCGLGSSAVALDREAFTFTKYDLEIRLEPDQQRLGARGKVTLRNDSGQPQKIAVLQISSSLSWRSIKVDG